MTRAVGWCVRVFLVFFVLGFCSVWFCCAGFFFRCCFPLSCTACPVAHPVALTTKVQHAACEETRVTILFSGFKAAAVPIVFRYSLFTSTWHVLSSSIDVGSLPSLGPSAICPSSH